MADAPGARITDIRVPDELVLTYERDGRQVETAFRGGCAWIGRLQYLRLHMDSEGVSEKHGKVEWDEDTRSWQLEDVGSTNGTKLNSNSLTPRARVSLSSGDTIELGRAVEVLVKIKPAADLKTMREVFKAHAAQFSDSNYGATEGHIFELHNEWSDSRAEFCDTFRIPEACQ